MNHWLALGTVWSFFVATVSVAFAILSHRRQVNASVYLDLSKQLHELYKRMPQKQVTDAPESQLPEGAAFLVFDSLQLIRSAYTLSRAGYFTGKLWTSLRNDAEKGLQKPAFRSLWPAMKAEFINDPDFISYVEKVQGRTTAR